MELFSNFWHLLCLPKYEVDFWHLPYLLKSVYFWYLPCLSVLTFDIYPSFFEKFDFWHLPQPLWKVKLLTLTLPLWGGPGTGGTVWRMPRCSLGPCRRPARCPRTVPSASAPHPSVSCCPGSATSFKIKYIKCTKQSNYILPILWNSLLIFGYLTYNHKIKTTIGLILLKKYNYMKKCSL